MKLLKYALAAVHVITRCVEHKKSVSASCWSEGCGSWQTLFSKQMCRQCAPVESEVLRHPLCLPSLDLVCLILL
jgi:hypothetical protein